MSRRRLSSQKQRQQRQQPAKQGFSLVTGNTGVLAWMLLVFFYFFCLYLAHAETTAPQAPRRRRAFDGMSRCQAMACGRCAFVSAPPKTTTCTNCNKKNSPTTTRNNAWGCGAGRHRPVTLLPQEQQQQQLSRTTTFQMTGDHEEEAKEELELAAATTPTTTTPSLPAIDGGEARSLDRSKLKAGSWVRQRLWTNSGGDGGSGMVLMDVENVRGKSGFALTHAQVLHATALWAQQCRLSGHVSLIVDHGQVESAHYLPPPHDLAIVFAGPRCKADDVIAHEVHLGMGQHHVDALVVITADRGLIDRCRRRSSATKTSVTILQPITFLEDLEAILQACPLPPPIETKEEESSFNDDDNNDDVVDSDLIVALDHEIKLGADLLEAEAMLRAKGGTSHKRKGKLKAKVRSLREKLRTSSTPLLEQVVANVLRPPSTSSSLFPFLQQQPGGGGTKGNHDKNNNKAFGRTNHNSDTTCGASTDVQPRLNAVQQAALLAKWDKVRKSTLNRKEKTGDRVILAEQWRQQLLQDEEEQRQQALVQEQQQQHETNKAADSRANVTNITAPAGSINLAVVHVFQYNARHQHAQQQEQKERWGEDKSQTVRTGGLSREHVQFLQQRQHLQKHQHGTQVPMINLHVPPVVAKSLRLVVISDTHGYEKTLANEEDGTHLLSGDVLLHLGDFAMDGNRKKSSVEQFDSWLSQQPHEHKIVIRGNHDPRTWWPTQSGATFITQPTTLTLGGQFVFALIPYISGGKLSNRLMPKRCHVLASHVPPKDVLDLCYSGKHAGSSALRKGVERMVTKNSGGPGAHSAPSLWLCGHIHESRGAIRHSFAQHNNDNKGSTTNHQYHDGGDRETLVVNVANANCGIAKRLDHGPVVLELTMEETGGNSRNNKRGQQYCRVEILSMDNQFEYLNR